jgi:ABC-2 type transport system ATP-binding protein
MNRIRIPVLLMQGENDTLFNLNEAVATYQALKAQGTPVKMVWQSWGHSGSTPAPGELDLANPDPASQYETGRIADWFDHYLKGLPVGTGPPFAYFRDWISYSGNASPAYATSGNFPVGRARTLYLSGDGSLAGAPTAVRPGLQSFVTPPAGPPSSIVPTDVLSGYVQQAGQLPQVDVPGTFASWTGPALDAPLDVVGSPVVTVRLQAPTAQLTQLTGPAGQLVLFAKVLDVAPDGTASYVHGLEAPIRVPDASQPIRITLPGIVHRFAAGHSIRLVLAGGSQNYRGGLTATPVTVAGGTDQTLVLPAVG